MPSLGRTGRGLGHGGLSSLPPAVGVLVERQVEIVELVMTTHAHQRHVVDVGRSCERCRPRNEVVGFASGVMGSALDASTVSGHEGNPLIDAYEAS